MIVHGPYPEPRVGIEAAAAVDAGYDVDILATRRGGDAASEIVSGARVLRLPVEHRRGIGVLASLREYLEFTLRAALAAGRLAWRQRYDVVQVHNPPDFLVLAAAVPRALGARVVLDIHDLSSDMFAMRFGARSGSGLVERLLRLVERWAASSSFAVLTVHEPYRQELAARGIPADKITVVMNSVDERLLPPASARRHPEPFTIVYHGTVTPHYGVDLIVEAAAAIRPSVPDLRVVIHGEGDGLPRLRSRAAELGLSDAVRIDGVALAREDVLRAVQGASVGVIPNLPTRLNRYALSTKLFEYVALGIPVVAAALPTLRSHFSDEEVLYFRPGDSESLAEALANVAADPSAAQRRVAAASRRYDAYRWEKNARAYLAVLDAASKRR
jgi:glycosyltransferase involved in cell wall biosynthesis